MLLKMVSEELQKAIDLIGLKKLGDICGVKYQSILGWKLRNKMPNTEYSGQTDYSLRIERATQGKVTITSLLGHVPVALQDKTK